MLSYNYLLVDLLFIFINSWVQNLQLNNFFCILILRQQKRNKILENLLISQVQRWGKSLLDFLLKQVGKVNCSITTQFYMPLTEWKNMQLNEVLLSISITIFKNHSCTMKMFSIKLHFKIPVYMTDNM